MNKQAASADRRWFSLQSASAIFFGSTGPIWKPAFLGALILWMAFPPLDWWPLAWLAIVPWISLICRSELPGRRPYAVLWAAGFAFWLAVLQWLRLPHPATGLGWVAIAFCFAFYVPLFIGLSRVAVHRLRIPVILAAPIVWTGLELVRAHLLSGMSMANLSHTQYRWISLIQISDLAGDYGVSFLVVCIAACFARMGLGDERSKKFWPIAPCILAAVLAYGYWRTAGEYTTPGPKVALIQGSIDIEMLNAKDADEMQRLVNERCQRMWVQYFQLSQEAMHQYGQVDLVVWPESMFPDSLVTFDADAEVPAWYQGTRAEFYAKLPEWAEACPKQLASVAKELNASLLVGLDTWHYGTHGDKVFASAACVARNGDFLGRYDKMHLIPYGEYVPFSEAFPWMLRLTPLPRSAVPGSKPTAFKIGNVWVAPSICYESVLTHVIRGQVNALKAEGHEPEVLVNVTNDGWFWGSSELDLHLVCGVFRAVECRKPFLVAANTGFSAWIDGNGRIQRKGPRHATGTLLAEVLLDRRTSWYLCHGDWFSGLCLLGCIVFGVVGQRDRMRRRSDSHAAQATA